MTKTPFEIQLWSLMASSLIICGLINLYLTLTHPTQSGISEYFGIGFIIIGLVIMLLMVQYYYDKRKNPDNPKKLYLAELDERDILVQYKTGWASFTLSLIIVGFFMISCGSILEILVKKSIDPGIISGVSSMGMLLFWILIIIRALTYYYFDKHT